MAQRLLLFLKLGIFCGLFRGVLGQIVHAKEKKNHFTLSKLTLGMHDVSRAKNFAKGGPTSKQFSRIFLLNLCKLTNVLGKEGIIRVYYSNYCNIYK